MPQPKLQPCDKPDDLDLEFLYGEEFTFQGQKRWEKWYREVETGMVLVDRSGQWFAVMPLFEN